ncbi:hypothetical protein GJAV_G00229940 [Gymnothorax javanicus]|nr:hypothetical protein GJAV_G00229940 [Gymnothorax javanicus]
MSDNVPGLMERTLRCELFTITTDNSEESMPRREEDTEPQYTEKRRRLATKAFDCCSLGYRVNIQWGHLLSSEFLTAVWLL